MRQYTVRDNNGKSWKRVSKINARKMFEAGNNICLCPSNFRPFGSWHHGIIVNPRGKSFDKTVNMFSYHNCNTETGKYVSFYVEGE